MQLFGAKVSRATVIFLMKTSPKLFSVVKTLYLTFVYLVTHNTGAWDQLLCYTYNSFLAWN